MMPIYGPTILLMVIYNNLHIMQFLLVIFHYNLKKEMHSVSHETVFINKAMRIGNSPNTFAILQNIFSTFCDFNS